MQHHSWLKLHAPKTLKWYNEAMDTDNKKIGVLILKQNLKIQIFYLDKCVRYNNLFKKKFPFNGQISHL